MRRVLHFLLGLGGLLAFTFSHAQSIESPQTSIRNYLSLLKTDKTDSAKTEHYKWLCYYYRVIGNMDTATLLGNQGLALARQANYKRGEAGCNTAVGLVFWNEGNYTAALDYFLTSMKIDEKIGLKRGIGTNSVNIGNIYSDQQEYDEALKYYNIGLDIDEQSGDTIGLIILNENIGSCYEGKGDKAKALVYYYRSLEESKGAKYNPGIARNTSDIGAAYLRQGDYDAALRFLLEGEKLSRVSEDKSVLMTAEGNLGITYLKLKKYSEAEKALLNALALSDTIHSLQGYSDYGNYLSDVYSENGQWEKAYKAYAQYSTAKDSLVGLEKNKQITAKTLTYDFEKAKEKMQADQEKKDLIDAEEKKGQRIILYAVSLVLLLVVLLAGFVFRGYRQKQKANVLLDRKNQTIEQQKEKVDAAYAQLHEKHKEITDSINYAKRIQQALFQDEEANTLGNMPEHYIFFKPRDVVSGDFYWRYEKDGYCYIAAVDCTGHGVPGAFLTMLGSAFLNEICANGNMLAPGEVLNQLRDKILRELSSKGEVKDGMDISLASLSPSKEGKQMQWAGANNPLWYLQNGEIKEIPADKQPIGYQDGQKPFSTHKVELNKGDLVYLFTDGYADQFGGPNEKKFKYNQLKETLKSIAHLPMKEQKQKLGEVFDTWKGKQDQTDDVCIIVLKV
jgi:serine phosphatase RsbU (regulator of sigma subunit)